MEIISGFGLKKLLGSSVVLVFCSSKYPHRIVSEQPLLQKKKPFLAVLISICERCRAQVHFLFYYQIVFSSNLLGTKPDSVIWSFSPTFWLCQENKPLSLS